MAAINDEFERVKPKRDVRVDEWDANGRDIGDESFRQLETWIAGFIGIVPPSAFALRTIPGEQHSLLDSRQGSAFLRNNDKIRRRDRGITGTPGRL